MVNDNAWQVSEFSHDIGKDEVVCPVTGYTYFAELKQSPHIDKDGEVAW